jgi:hypothetical protein
METHENVNNGGAGVVQTNARPARSKLRRGVVENIQKIRTITTDE